MCKSDCQNTHSKNVSGKKCLVDFVCIVHILSTPGLSAVTMNKLCNRGSYKVTIYIYDRRLSGCMLANDVTPLLMKRSYLFHAQMEFTVMGDVCVIIMHPGHGRVITSHRIPWYAIYHPCPSLLTLATTSVYQHTVQWVVMIHAVKPLVLVAPNSKT